ncbi:hypothetical protein SLE2022_392500 [Rubroshorea leprosula]
MFAHRFFITMFLLSVLSFTTEAQNQTYIYHFCSNTTSFTRNSTYQSNLNSLLSALSSNATATSTNGFYYTTSGETPIGSTVSSSVAATFQPLLVKIASRLPPEM